MSKTWWLLVVPALVLAAFGLVLSGNGPSRERSWDSVVEAPSPAATARVEQTGSALAGVEQTLRGPAAQVEETPAAHPPVAAAPLKVTPPGGSRKDYPEPGDPTYADYQEMLRQPEYQLSVSNSPGYRLPYDPEWRSMVDGKRQVATHDRAFTTGGSTSLDELAEEYVFGLNQGDEGVLKDLRVTREDFVGILWPEFPQSRPALHIPEDEAWFFEISHLTQGLQKSLAACAGRHLKLEAVQVTSAKAFTNFRVLEVRMSAVDQASGESVAITGDKGGTVVERLGRYKFYLYRK